MPRFRIAPDTAALVEGWSNCKIPEPTALEAGETPSASADATSALQWTLSETLNAEHLVVLAGLGTSLEIREIAGSSKFPTMDTLWDLISRRAGATFDAVRKAVNYFDGPQPGDGDARNVEAPKKNIEELLSRCQMAETLGSDKSVDFSSFIKTAEDVITETCSYRPDRDETSVHEDFLRRVVHRGPRKPRANLFTTNYDRCFEIAASRIGLPVMDGFSFTQPPRFAAETFDFDLVTHSIYSKEPDYIPRLLRLYKLHGSVDWERTGDGIERREKVSRPLLIYPRYGKYEASYAPPFLDMMSRFQSVLRNPNVGVLVVCFGFHDQHIAEPLFSAVRANTGLRMVVVAPDVCGLDADRLYGAAGLQGSAKTNRYLAQFDKLIERGDNRLTLVNAKFSELVKMIPLLSMHTEAEQQEARIRQLESWAADVKGRAGAKG